MTESIVSRIVSSLSFVVAKTSPVNGRESEARQWPVCLVARTSVVSFRVRNKAKPFCPFSWRLISLRGIMTE